MTGAQVKEARERLGMTQAQLAEAMRMGPNGRRQVIRWEMDDTPISGPASVLLELWTKKGKK